MPSYRLICRVSTSPPRRGDTRYRRCYAVPTSHGTLWHRPIVRMRKPRDDELYVMMVFEHHAAHCHQCKDPLHAHRSGRTLCDRGLQCAVDVADYLYTRHGETYSVIGLEKRRPTLVRIHYRYTAVYGLLLAIEEGLIVQPKQSSTPTVDHRNSNSRTYTLSPRQESPPQKKPVRYVKVIEREPADLRRSRHGIARHHSRFDPSRRGSLYEPDPVECIKRTRRYLRVYRPVHSYSHRYRW